MAGTAITSPARTSAGRSTSRTTMSPLSQCLPTILHRASPSAPSLPARAAVYDAPYRAGRILSDIPPSTAT